MRQSCKAAKCTPGSGAHCSWLKATVVAGRKSAEEPPTMAKSTRPRCRSATASLSATNEEEHAARADAAPQHSTSACGCGAKEARFYVRARSEDESAPSIEHGEHSLCMFKKLRTGVHGLGGAAEVKCEAEAVGKHGQRAARLLVASDARNVA